MKKKTHNEYVDDVSKKCGDISVLGNYKNSRIKIEHRHDVCGHIWLAKPQSILDGRGCPSCNKKIKKSHHEYTEFIKTNYPTITVVGDYVSANTKISHKCDLCGFIWNSKPANFLYRDYDCPNCSGNIITIDNYKKRLFLRFGDELEVIDTYININTSILHKHISCNTIFETTPHYLLYNRSNTINCPTCSPTIQSSNLLYDIRLHVRDITRIGQYINNKTKILHRCNICDYTWLSKPNDILDGHGCHRCSGVERKTVNDFVSLLHKKHITLLSDYISNNVACDFKCDICTHEWSSKPSNIIYGDSGCPKCAKNGYSKLAIHWLESFNNPNIQHAENVGEYNIPNTRMRVDGYDPTTNTVYEFLGDVWHGNLVVFEEHEQCHPFSDKTAKELNDEWIERKTILEKMGYNVVFIWEDEWRNK